MSAPIVERLRDDQGYRTPSITNEAADAIEDLLYLVIQYRDDLRHPPAKDSIERRLDAINKALVKAGAI